MPTTLRNLLSLAALAALSLAPRPGAAQEPAPGLAAVPERPFEAPTTPGLLLPDVTGVSPGAGPEAAPAERVRRLDVLVPAEGAPAAGVPVDDVPWRGLRLPEDSRRAGTPVISLDEARFKLLLVGPRGEPLTAAAPGARVVLRLGARTLASWEEATAALREARERGVRRVIVDVRGAVPTGFAVTALALVCELGLDPGIAAAELDLDAGSPSRADGALGRALAAAIDGCPRGPGGRPLLGLRLRADARAPWAATGQVLDPAARLEIRRVTFVARQGAVEVDIAPRGGVQLAAEPVEKPIIILEEDVELLTEVPRPTGDRDPDSGRTVVDAYGVGGGAAGAYGQRWGKGALAREGGSAATEAAVTAALGWLKRHQAADGSWSAAGWQQLCQAERCAGPHPGREAGPAGSEVRVTALALLACAGNGHTHRFGTYKTTVNRGLQWLKRQQRAGGALSPRADQDEAGLVEHAIATTAICELYATSRDFTIRRYAEQGVAYLLAAEGRWTSPRVVGWSLTALVAARTAGLSVPPDAIERARGSLERTPGRGAELGLGLAARLLAGERSTGPGFEAGAAAIAAAPPTWPGADGRADLEAWVHGGQALFLLGGARWKAWNESLSAALLPAQRTGACVAGSWDPPAEGPGGRVEATATCALMLEVYYRYERPAPR